MWDRPHCRRTPRRSGALGAHSHKTLDERSEPLLANHRVREQFGDLAPAHQTNLIDKGSRLRLIWARPAPPPTPAAQERDSQIAGQPMPPRSQKMWLDREPEIRCLD